MVSNSGPSDAQNVVITDSLPVSTTLVGAGAGCNLVGNAVVCTVGTLAAGASQSFLVEVRVDAAAANGLILTNMVTATSPTGATTSDSVTTTVQQPSGGQADLVVAKSGAPTVVAGNQLAYTVVVTNNGPSLAQDVTLVDALPSGTIFVAAAPSQGTCNGGVTCLLGTLAMNATATVRITVTVAGDTTGNLVNVAQASSSNPDSNLANNRAPFTTTATAQAALYVSKVATPEPAVLGGQLTYRIVVTNAGPSAAQHVTVTDNLPAALLNPVVSSSQGGCVAFPCALGTIPAGGSATILVVGKVASDGDGQHRQHGDCHEQHGVDRIR